MPSDLVLYNNFHIVCNIVLDNNYSINSLANINQNRYFNCIEFFGINEKIKIGIKIYQIQKKIKFSTYYFFTGDSFKYNILSYQNNDIFDPLINNEKYNSLIKKIYDKNLNETYKLEKSYIHYPYCALKRQALLFDEKWTLNNIYNHYFCFCKGNNCFLNYIPESCKYYFYLSIIDNNKNVYKKTDFLFLDFIFADLSSDDVFPVFEKMFNLKFPVHYITENHDIYNRYCKDKSKCLTILKVQKEKNPINGSFLEKYLTLFLKLKIVVSGRGTTFNTNIFYNIEYISYICVGHGVCYFKYFLYKDNRIYGIKKNNKLLLPNSEKIISIAKKYGWKDENIIKINLPRWDKYLINEDEENTNKIRNNSIFIMFTWRHIKEHKSISNYYLKNIMNLIFDNKLKIILKKKNILIYLSFHRLVNENYLKNIKNEINKNKYIKYITQNEISQCLKLASLVISDFSSIIFDLMYRRKPYIIYIPDANDPLINDLYKIEYYELIESMKNGTIYFENTFIGLKETIKKIIYYINNNFILDEKLEKFYNTFGFKKENAINNLIDYLKIIK